MKLRPSRLAITGAVTLALISVGCWRYGRLPEYRPSATTLFSSPQLVHGNGQVPTVDLVVKGFRIKGQKVDDSFGYYVYLYFAAPKLGEATKHQASDAFLDLFPDPAFGSADHSRLALAVAPIKHDKLPQTAQQLVTDYDYEHSQTVVHTLSNGELPAVALIGVQKSFDSGKASDPLVLDLCKEPAQVRQKILQLRNNLLTKPKPQAASVNVSQVMRSFLGSIGATVIELVGGKAALAAAECP